jgi:methylglutaconyl-CoA hydratase
MLVQVEKIRDSVVKITLNRPEKRNALSIALLRELKTALKEHLHQNRVVILAGAGKVFCAGLDLAEANEVPFQEHLGSTLRDCLILLAEAPCITIAAVHGAAIAGGAGFAAACDICIADENAQFSFPETRRGLVPSLIMPLLKQKLSRTHLNELVYLCESISAARAAEIGLINRTTRNLETDLAETVSLALLSAPGAVTQTKRLLDELDDSTLVREIQQAYHSHTSMREAEEAMEGVSAFLQGRSPKWTV